MLMLAAAALLWLSGDVRRRPVVELLAIIAIASLIPGLLLRIGAGSAYYFLNIGAWIAIVSMAGLLLLPRLAEVDRPVLVTAGVMLIAAVAAVCQPQLRDSGSKFSAMLNALDQPNREPAERRMVSRTVWEKLFALDDTTRMRIADLARRSPGGQMHELLNAAGVPGSRDQVVYIPPRNTQFWTMHEVCFAVPFFVPALAGVPMIYGLPPDKETCPIGRDQGYGYASYSEESRSATVSDAQLCEHARQIGFKKVVIMDSPLALRMLSCA
jgi:hypothetical protein